MLLSGTFVCVEKAYDHVVLPCYGLNAANNIGKNVLLISGDDYGDRTAGKTPVHPEICCVGKGWIAVL